MAVAVSSTPREARWLGARLRALNPPLPVYRNVGQGSSRHIVYRRQGGTDAHVVSGTTIEVTSSWLVYVSQPVASGTMVYVEDLQDDADRIHDAILDTAGAAALNGRYVAALKRDIEYELPVYSGNTLMELQLGGIYVLSTQLA